jgi:SAM-dependent methyltransferase
MTIDDSALLTDKSYLTQVQYRTDANLAARQSVYFYQQPRIDLVATVLDLAGLTGTEIVADIGCGNGIYLAGLTSRGHAGRVLGADLSPGMLAAARTGAPQADVILGDATALPVADSVADVTLAAHMLYHVPDRPAASGSSERGRGSASGAVRLGPPPRLRRRARAARPGTGSRLCGEHAGGPGHAGPGGLRRGGGGPGPARTGRHFPRHDPLRAADLHLSRS